MHESMSLVMSFNDMTDLVTNDQVKERKIRKKKIRKKISHQLRGAGGWPFGRCRFRNSMIYELLFIVF